MSKFELFPKEWTATHGGHEIRVRNSWSHGLRLYVDGDCRAKSNRLFVFSSSEPVLSHQVVADGASFLIQVFCSAWLTVKAKIVVDGRQIGGANF